MVDEQVATPPGHVSLDGDTPPTPTPSLDAMTQLPKSRPRAHNPDILVARQAQRSQSKHLDIVYRS